MQELYHAMPHGCSPQHLPCFRLAPTICWVEMASTALRGVRTAKKTRGLRRCSRWARGTVTEEPNGHSRFTASD